MPFSITTELKNQAIRELTASHRRRTPSLLVSDETIRQGAEEVFNYALQGVVELLTKHPPTKKASPSSFERLVRMDLSPSTRARMEETIRASQAAKQRAVDTINATQRTGLIHLLTMDDGVSQSTAEKIVDHLIAQA